MKNDLENLQPLMSKRGVKVSQEVFHKAVNTIFHDVESKYYDTLHHDMDSSLQEQVDLLADDILKVIAPNVPGQFILLDVGCGTGMSTDKLLKTRLGKYISKVYLLDTSKGMLKQCAAKAVNWGIPFEVIEDDIFSLKNAKFDLILTCSVLHHIPNLDVFLGKIASLQKERGFFIHLHDSNGDSVFTENYVNRKNELRNFKKTKNLPGYFSKILIDKIKGKIKRFTGIGKKDYIDEVNEKLMEQGIIKTPMTDVEIWSVTDLHVEDLPNHYGKGISFAFLQNQLSSYNCISRRSYRFFGDLKMLLPPSFREQEEKWISENKLDGHELSAVWQLK